MQISITTAQEHDLSSILDLYAQPAMDDGKVLSLEEAKILFQKMNSYPNYRIYVAKNEAQKIIGTFALLIMDNLGHQGAASGIVEDVVVDLNYQGKGIGKQMMQFALKVCKEANCYKLVLSSNLKRTNAHQFYESLGFKRHGISFLMQGEPLCFTEKSPQA